MCIYLSLRLKFFIFFQLFSFLTLRIICSYLLLLMKVKEEREKVDLKLNIQKTKIMASSPITSREIDGETVETVSDFIFLGFKITADGDCSHELKEAYSFPGLGRFPGEGNSNPLQYSCLENPMDGGAWCRLLSMGSQRVGHD